jgi:hypothetical protein
MNLYGVHDLKYITIDAAKNTDITCAQNEPYHSCLNGQTWNFLAQKTSQMFQSGKQFKNIGYRKREMQPNTNQTPNLQCKNARKEQMSSSFQVPDYA